MIYAIQTIIYGGIVYFFYWLLLKDKDIHRFNRFYLFVAAFIPFLLPFVELSFFSKAENPVRQYFNVLMPEVTVTNSSNVKENSSASVWLLFAYLGITCSVIVFNIYKLMRLQKIIRNAEAMKANDYILLINTGYGPGSWSKYIFLPERDTDARIIEHEVAHIRLHHSRDYPFLNVLQCIFWFNPFLHFIKKELKHVHEFEADAAVKADKGEYQKLLLHHFLNQCQLPFTHSFINHPIKRRIMMLNKKTTGRNKAMRITLTITAFLFFVGNIIWLQSCKTKKNETNEDVVTFPKGKVGKLTYQSGNVSGEIYTWVEKMPKPTINVGEFLAQNIQYPEEAKKKNIEGRIMVRFVVNKDGNVTDANVLTKANEKLPQHELELFSDEALRVINLMPAWIPGEKENGEKVDVYFTQPISFQLEKKTGQNDFEIINEKTPSKTVNSLNHNSNWIFAEEMTKEEYDKLEKIDFPEAEKVYWNRIEATEEIKPTSQQTNNIDRSGIVITDKKGRIITGDKREKILSQMDHSLKQVEKMTSLMDEASVLMNEASTLLNKLN